ncbi:hypothetical protein [Prevotella sp.]|uniref:hypothetical protein n=1 Tax=Prevotella sp. TaxID=59823 RepID=UPI002649C599|nr:hypothetical protein [Prevotella sp.]MDN5553542.1 hypothetical protein [Prevotella sp.]
MRSLNEFEKEVVKYMVLKNKPEQELFIYNLLYRFCGAYYIEWNEEMTEIIVMYSIEQNWEQIRQKLFDFIVLIQYLDEEKYIGIFSSNIGQNERKIYDHSKYELDGDNIKEYNIYRKLDGVYYLIPTKCTQLFSGIGKDINKYVLSSYHVTQALIDFTDHNFKTKGEIRFRKNMWATWVSIIIAFIIGLAGIIINCLK